MKWRKVETLKGYIHVKNYKILNIMISLWGKVNKYIKKSLELTLLETQKNKKYRKIRYSSIFLGIKVMNSIQKIN